MQTILTTTLFLSILAGYAFGDTLQPVCGVAGDATSVQFDAVSTILAQRATVPVLVSVIVKHS